MQNHGASDRAAILLQQTGANVGWLDCRSERDFIVAAVDHIDPLQLLLVRTEQYRTGDN
ncbi:hypothetical protein D3C86_1907250 [compost metagenome]